MITKPDSCHASAWNLNRLSSSSRPSRARTQKIRERQSRIGCRRLGLNALAWFDESTMGLERVASNHQRVDFAGSVENLKGLAVPEESLHAAAGVDTEGAEDLDRFDGVPHSRVGA